MSDQLTLKIDTPKRALPIAGRVKIGGVLEIERDLKKDTTVTVIVVDSNGEKVCEKEAEVSGISFRTKHSETGDYVERVHTVTL